MKFLNALSNAKHFDFYRFFLSYQSSRKFYYRFALRPLSFKPTSSSESSDKYRESDHEQNLEAFWKKEKQRLEENDQAKTKIWKYAPGIITIMLSGLVFIYTYRYQNKCFDVVDKQFTSKVTQTGKPDIGGPWTLTNHNNERISSDSLKGNWIIYYFGFVHCPDICPEEMEKIAALVRRSRKKFKIDNIIPVFVSVDPERDDSESIKTYINNFSKDFIGFTGKPEEIASICKKYRIFYTKGDADELGNYQVDHSICSYLFDPNGDFATYFMKSEKVSDRMEKIEKYVKKFESGDKDPIFLK